MKNIYLLSILLFQIGFAQSPAIEWQKSFGGSDGDIAYDIKQTNDGGYIFVSYTMSTDGDVTNLHGSSDIWVVKTSATGEIEWQKTLGGSLSESAVSLQLTADGGYILAGNTTSIDGDITEFHDNGCVWVVKLSGTGAIEWQKIYPLPDGGNAFTIRQTADGGYIFVGSAFVPHINPNNGESQGGTDVRIVKLSALGVLEWQKILGGLLYESGINILQTNDNGYILLGNSNSSDGDLTTNHGDDDLWIVKLSNTSEIEWQKSIGGSSSESAVGLCLTTDGGYVIAGRTQSSDGDITGFHGGGVDAWVVKLNAQGTIEWQRALGGSNTDVLFDIKQTDDGGYIAVGDTVSNDGDVSGYHPSTISSGDCWVVRLSGTGNLMWQKCLGGSESDGGNRVVIASDGGYIISGLSLSNDGDVLGHHNNYDCWIVKLAPDNLGIANPSNQDLRLYPNPTDSLLTINNTDNLLFDKILITDLTGKKVIEQQGSNQMNVEKLADGVYLLNAFSGNQTFVRKFIKQ